MMMPETKEEHIEGRMRMRNKIKGRIISIILVVTMLLNEVYASGFTSYASERYDTNNVDTEFATEGENADSEAGTEETDIGTEAAEDEQSDNNQDTETAVVTEDNTEEVQADTTDVEDGTSESDTSTESGTDENLNANSEDTEGSTEENIEEIMADDLIVDEDVILTENLTVGNLTINNKAVLDLNGYNVTVEGNCEIISGEVTVNKGEVYCMGDLSVDSDGKLTMNNINDYLFIAGELTLHGKAEMSAGVIELKGDFNANKSFQAVDNHKVILSGENKQTVTLNEGGFFATIELRNFSKEGIYVTYSFQADNIIDNDCIIQYADLNGVRGTKLSEDTTVDGLYYLIYDTLDLNGFTLTINGDLVQGGGNININGGKLIVNGDYRVQTRTEDEAGEVKYGNSTGSLIMNNSEDYLCVGGDYTNCNSNAQTGKLTNGIMEITGDVTVSKTAHSQAFVPEKEHVVRLTGSDKQEVSVYQNNDRCLADYNHIANLEMANTIEDGICFTTLTYVSGTVTQNENKAEGTMLAGISTYFTDNVYRGDIKYYSSFDGFNQEMTIYGNLTILYYYYMKNNLTIYGDLIGGANSSYTNFYMPSYSVYVYGDSKNINYVMQDDSVYAYIEGDFTGKYSDGMKKGTIEIKGNVNFENKMTTSGSNVIILSGDKLQTITNADKMNLATLEIRNTSEDGVYADTAIKKNKLIRNGCRLRYGDIEGEFGWTLNEDYVHEGDLVIVDDVLDLNGHTLTVHGSLIQLSGEIRINNGKLVIDDDYRMQSMLDNNGSVEYTKGTGTLTMNQTPDYIYVGGDFVNDTSVASELTAGTLEINGNFEGNNFTASKAHNLIFCGNSSQSITANSKTTFYNVEFMNTSEEGIIITGTVYVYGAVKDDSAKVDGCISIASGTTFVGGEFGGSIRTVGDWYIDDSIHIRGSLSNSKQITVSSGGKLTVDGNFDNYNNIKISGDVVVGGDYTAESQGSITMNEGNLIIYGNALFDNYSGYAIDMTHAKDYIHIYSDFSYIAYCSSRLSAGTIEIGKNVNIERYFSAGDSHKIILAGEDLQTIKMANDCSFGILELKNYSEAGVYSDTTFNKIKLIRNGCKLKYGDSDGVFGWKLTEDEIWEGNLILLDDTLDLNGHTLTVNGNIIQQSGEIKPNGGTLLVNGDYRMQTQQIIDDVETYGDSSARLNMNNSKDYVLINGSLYVQTSANHNDIITNGTIEITENIWIDNELNKNAFYMSGEAVLVGNCETR